MNRLVGLDYLRGIAAFGIMLYHFLLWNFGRFLADTFMCRVGIYGVSVFYILSGLTLYYVYYQKMIPTGKDLKHFAQKRLFRILPLLWLASIVAIILSKKPPNFFYLFLNLTGLFGFFKWDTYFSTGVWSIGNELVFYAFFPLFVWLSKTKQWAFWLLCLILFSIYTYFSFSYLHVLSSLPEQWSVYVNPLNQVFLFLMGFLMGLFFHHKKTNPLIALFLGFLGVLIFIFFPVNSDAIRLVTGSNRLIFTVCAFFICFGFYKTNFQIPYFIHKPFSLLGEASYSVYLLHPLVYPIVNVVFKFLSIHSVYPKIVLAIGITLLVSYFSYQYFEKYFIRLGARLANK